jgi:hypothetical protein
VIVRSPRVTLLSREQVSTKGGEPRVAGSLVMLTDKGRLLR